MRASEFDRLNRADELALLPLGTVEIIVAGKVVPKGRPRHFIHKNTGKLVAMTPKETRKYEEIVRDEAALVMRNRRMLDGPIVADLQVFVGMPQYLAKRYKTLTDEQVERGPTRPLSKPDWDNFGKVCDAVNGIVWRDDCLVVDGRVRKFYSRNPRLEFRAYEL